ncbi:MAG: GHKL domain-containing protein [Lachnospiraceae bacterium]|nr:GHKL domain-containing protein [Lachnospiraceae bacterium]
MTTLINILHYTSDLLSGWLVMHAMSYLIRISGKRCKRLLLFAGCSFLCAMIIFIGDPFNILGTTPIFLVIVLLTCEGSFWQKLTIGLMFSSTVFSFNALRDNYIHDLLFPAGQDGITVIIFGGSNSIRLPAETLMLSEHGYSISSTFILPFALTLYLYTRKFAPDKDYVLSDSMWRLLLFLTVIPLSIVLAVVTLFPINDYATINIRVHQEYVILLLVSLLAFISLLWCVTVLARQRELEQQSMFAEINRKYYEAMEQQHFEVRRLKHDLANHMQVLSALPEERRAAYIRELSDNPALSQSFAYCGDSTVNAVLTVKKSVMERCHIRMKMEIDIPAPLPYDKTDLCALYANALDNAMEACMKLEEAQREITLKCMAGKGLFCLEVSNPDPGAKKMHSISQTEKQAAPISEKTPERRLFPSTSKPDKTNHGFGLQSIQEIVKRYHGSLEIKTESGIFDLFIYLPLTVR